MREIESGIEQSEKRGSLFTVIIFMHYRTRAVVRAVELPCTRRNVHCWLESQVEKFVLLDVIHLASNQCTRAGSAESGLDASSGRMLSSCRMNIFSVTAFHLSVHLHVADEQLVVCKAFQIVPRARPKLSTQTCLTIGQTYRAVGVRCGGVILSADYYLHQ